MRKRHIEAKSKKESSLISFIVRALLAFLVVMTQIVLPIAPAFANETDGESVVAEAPQQTTEVSPDDVEELEPIESVEEESAIEEVESDSVTPEETSENEPDLTSLDEITEEESVDTETLVTDENDTSAPSESAQSSTDDDILVVDDATTTPEGQSEAPALETEVGESEPTPEPEAPSIEETPEAPPIEEEEFEPVPDEVLEEVVEESASSTPTTTLNVVEPELHTVSSDSLYTFDMNDCARVADGSFYCTPESEGAVVEYTDRIFAGPDSDGDSEIFIEKGGVITQLTSNTADDAAPFYDERSNTVVFHRLVDARYQIISLDLETGEETQLTFDSYNNMQPSRFGDLIVWQGWVGNDWEIILSNDGEISMLTDNTSHDIGPRINGEFVIWQAESETGWEVRVYNTLTGFTESIDETEGASIENPRLVLVYDAKHGNGDVETRGYDLNTGRNISLSSESGNIPDELPDPDQTGEERALIVATQQKTKSEDDDGEPDSLDGETNDPLPPTDSVLDEGDIVIPPFETGTTTGDTTDGDVVTEPVMTIEDLVVPPPIDEPIEPPVPDLVVPEFVGTASSSEDSQE
jgi:hypothetical protein